MARYSIVIKTSAVKEIERIADRAARRRVVQRIQSLAENPRPRGCEKLAGGTERYRVRPGAYRIIYSIEDERLVVHVVKVGHRRDIYR